MIDNSNILIISAALRDEAREKIQNGDIDFLDFIRFDDDEEIKESEETA